MHFLINTILDIFVILGVAYLFLTISLIVSFWRGRKNLNVSRFGLYTFILINFVLAIVGVFEGLRVALQLFGVMLFFLWFQFFFRKKDNGF